MTDFPARESGGRDVAACFTVALGLPRALVLAESFRRRHPDVPCFVAAFGRPATSDEPWAAVDLSELGVEDERGFAFRWGLVERQAVCRPRLIRRLFDVGFRSVLSFAGGGEVVGSLDDLLARLEDLPLILGRDVEAASSPELWLGRRSPETEAVLASWQSSVERRPNAGLRGYPVAERCHVLEAAEVPLLELVDVTSAAGDRRFDAYTLRRLRRRHGEALATATRIEGSWRDPAATFDDAVTIPEIARTLYRELGEQAREFGDPFRSSGAETFRAWLNQPVDELPDATRRVTRLWHGAWRRSAELRRAFSDVLGRDRDAFLSWVTSEGWKSEDISERFIVQPFRRRERREVRRDDLAFGVNLSGLLESEKGVGEAGRSLARCLQSASLPFVAFAHRDLGSRNGSAPPIPLGETNPFAINLVCVNAAAVPAFVAARGQDYFAGRVNVAHWVWETPEFPRQWQSSITEFDEVWTPSAFVAAAVREVSPVPVHTVPYALADEVAEQPPPRLGIPPEVFVFAFLMDFASCTERKNAHGLVRAFRQAFGARKDVLLMLKCVRPEFLTGAWSDVLEESRGCNVRISEIVLDRARTLALLQRADCYVSLHRSEGFGLTLAESMSLAKPVIATGYSGNMDFMTTENSLPVDFRLVPVAEAWGPYRRGYVWAEPSLEHATELMRWVERNREAAAALGLRARESVRALLDPKKVGERIVERIEALSGKPRSDARA